MSARVRASIVGLTICILFGLFAVGATPQPRSPLQTWGPPPGWQPPTALAGPPEPTAAPAPLARTDARPTLPGTQEGKTDSGRGSPGALGAKPQEGPGYADGYEAGYRAGFDAGYHWAIYNGGILRSPGGYYFYPRGLYHGMTGPGSRYPAGPNGLYVGPGGMRPVY